MLNFTLIEHRLALIAGYLKAILSSIGIAQQAVTSAG